MCSLTSDGGGGLGKGAPGDSGGGSSSKSSSESSDSSPTSLNAKGKTVSFDMGFLKNPLSLLGAWEEGTSPITNPVDRTISDVEGKSLLDQKDEAQILKSTNDFWHMY